MRARWLLPAGVLLLLVTLVNGQPARLGGPIVPVGFLIPERESARPTPYQPRAGDLVLYDDFNRFYHAVFKLAGTSPPSHVAMVIHRPDGTPALLELTGPVMITAKVAIVDVEPRLSNYPGIVMVRRLKYPLSPDQSERLTQFAQAQSGKSFALGRVVLQGSFFSPRTGLRKELFGKTYLNRNRWFCSELVASACASAWILDAKKTCANATYPRDFAFDEMMDLSSIYHPAVFWNAAQK
jgi:hypothetical protein